MADEDESGSINIQAVAREAGVSKTTVSHVLSGNRHVAEKTRTRVLEIMDKFGYRPNFHAQALVTQRSQSIALITQDITNPFYPVLARGVQSAATVKNYLVMLFDAGIDNNNIHAFMQVVGQRRLDGVIAAVGDAGPAVEAIAAAGIPVVTVGPSPFPQLDWVSADDRQIARDAVSALVEKGHRRIAIINGVAKTMPGSARLRGYLAALEEFGLDDDPSLQFEGHWTREGGAAAMTRLLSLAQPATAVFCANDLMAIGALDTAYERGLSVPDDIAVLGVDDIEAASLVRPALTTIQVPAHQIGVAACQILLGRMGGETGAPRHMLLPHTLINRSSI